MKEVYGWWEVPSICYYCSLFGNAFALPEFTIDVSVTLVVRQITELIIIDNNYRVCD